MLPDETAQDHINTSLVLSLDRTDWGYTFAADSLSFVILGPASASGGIVHSLHAWSPQVHTEILKNNLYPCFLFWSLISYRKCKFRNPVSPYLQLRSATCADKLHCLWLARSPSFGERIQISTEDIVKWITDFGLDTFFICRTLPRWLSGISCQHLEKNPGTLLSTGLPQIKSSCLCTCGK